MTNTNVNTATYLSYYTERHCSPQWNRFLALVFDELMTQTDREGASGFLRHIGSRLAAEWPLGEYETLEALELSINGALNQLDWGWVSIRPEGNHLSIQHVAFPVPGTTEHTLDKAFQAMSAVLEGLYTTWINEQGGSGKTPLRCVDTNVTLRSMTFHYGQ
ncbi:cellulose biosynthesis protein BcsD [Halomonas sp. CUBES01]|uniref:Cellulose biosynthesis protein BcsD n=1 Tax=Vreelandella gomseomensis TaxID=370766 RepID=A0ABU1GET7_9GAMM|nr:MULTISPECIES: cellulose biosynthesis protein BcsD [Halomonas]MDR5875987.1 cellulose biosynthesis protein BcsD [Halomonas gomseomensis]MEC4766682.1 cellulose biosynthesis protein BcsD [Halomonas sp. CUBES01]